MKYITTAILILLALPAWAAVDTPDAITFHPLSDNSGDPETYSHTVTSGTSLLLVVTAHKANEECETISWNGNSMNPVTDADDSINTGDVSFEVYGLLSPTPAIGNVSVDCSTTNQGTWSWSAAINFTGTTTSVLGTTVSVKSTDLNNGNGGTGTTATNVHASAGSSGNALLFIGTQNGADGLPVSNNATFTEILEQETGGGSTAAADATAYIAEKLSGLPSAITVTFNQDDDNVGILLEIEAAGSAPEFSSGPTMSETTGGFSLVKWPQPGEWLNYEGSVFGPNGLLRHADRGEAILARVLGEKYRSITTDYQFRTFEYTNLVLMPPGKGDCLEGFLPEGARIYVAMGEDPEPGDVVLVKFSERTRAALNYFAERGFPGVPYTPPDGTSVKIYSQIYGREILMNNQAGFQVADNEILGVVRYADIDGTLAYMAPGDPGPPQRGWHRHNGG